jgi:hypothetical protein
VRPLPSSMRSVWLMLCPIAFRSFAQAAIAVGSAFAVMRMRRTFPRLRAFFIATVHIQSMGWSRGMAHQEERAPEETPQPAS